MPTYEYRCTSCGHELEAFQKITEAALKKCPKCGKQKLERLISGGNFVLKGSGWYRDLYSSSKPGDSSGKDKSDRLTKAVNDDKKKTEKKVEAA